MKKYFALHILFIFLIVSCKKKEFPQNVFEEPTFYVSATIDGKPVSIKAGFLGYYMYSSFKQDTNNLYTFIAEVKPGNCTSNCNNSLKIELNDNQLSTPGGTSNISNSVKPGDYIFANVGNSVPSISGYSVQFQGIFDKNTTIHNWSFGDGGTSTDHDPIHTYSATGIYNTDVTVTNVFSSTASVSNPVKVTIDPDTCQTRIFINSVSGDTIRFANSTSGMPPYVYHWDFGDMAYSPDANPTHIYQHQGLYSVNLRVIDANNDAASYTYNINTAQSSGLAANFSVTSVSAIYSNTLTSLFSKVKISYTDDNGIVYSSYPQSQISGSSNFQIISVEEYKKNENNETTKKIKVAFNCKLYNGNNSVDLKNGEAVIAVSYK